MISAIHYPHSRVPDAATMKHALLFWDHYHVIGPYRGFRPDHEGELAEAWSIIGRVTVPDAVEQRRAHDDILEFLATRNRLNPRFFLPQSAVRSEEIYEIYPQKLLGDTWWELKDAGLAGDLLPNADRPMTRWGGLVVMAKLADACAGTMFSRVTNETAAYRAIASDMHASDTAMEQEKPGMADVAPVLLGMIDAASIPLPRLIKFRDEERDPTFRHNLVRRVSDYLGHLRGAESMNQVRALQDSFEREMTLDLERLKDELRTNRIQFGVSTAALTVLSGGLAAAAAAFEGPLQLGAQLAAATAGGAAVKDVAQLFGAGLDLRKKQREVMLKHPMAYMHTLSRRVR